ncbi:MAG TPA: guanylate kinase [Stellaceae bacterium]|jgi:guanylate kinase|nr:guanylate kinase [Stellaceae bacterium]
MGSNPIKRRGILLVLSSPSGAGKTTITRALVAQDSKLAISVSATTRPMRRGEIDGQDYYFLDQARFAALVREDGLLEHATVFNHSYGTPRAPVIEALERGSDIISDVDWQGTQQLKAKLRADLVSVFILPPSLPALEERLKTRAQDNDSVVHARMAKSADEMSHWPEYDYVIVNDDLVQTVNRVHAILDAERVRRERQIGLDEFVNRLRGGN